MLVGRTQHFLCMPGTLPSPKWYIACSVSLYICNFSSLEFFLHSFVNSRKFDLSNSKLCCSLDCLRCSQMLLAAYLVLGSMISFSVLDLCDQRIKFWVSYVRSLWCSPISSFWELFLSDKVSCILDYMFYVRSGFKASEANVYMRSRCPPCVCQTLLRDS